MNLNKGIYIFYLRLICKFYCMFIIVIINPVTNTCFEIKKYSHQIGINSFDTSTTGLTIFAFRSSDRDYRRLLSDFDNNGGTDQFGMFPIFLKRTSDFLVSHLSVLFQRFLRSLHAGDKLMQPQFRRVRLPPPLPIADRFPYHQCCLRCLSIWFRFVVED